MLLNTDTKLSGEEDCDTLNPILLNIKTAEHLRRVVDRYYKIPQRIGEPYKLIKHTDTHLIGREILLRSPATCSSKTGVCDTCYGELAYINRDINSIGGLAGTRITEPISQNILSTKHLLTTTSKKIKFPDKFHDIFTVNSNEITVNIQNDNIELSDYTLLILKDNIVSIDEFNENRHFNNFITTFNIRDIKNSEIYEFKEEDELELYFTKEFGELIKDVRPVIVDEDSEAAVYEINLANLEDIPIFVVEIINKELTKPLYDIMELLNKESHKDCTTVDEMCQLMLDLLIVSRIDSKSVHGEVLIRPLIRDANDILRRPKWNKYNHKYQLLTVAKALINHPSPTLGLSFQKLARQLISPITFRKKEPSFIDAFYRERP